MALTRFFQYLPWAISGDQVSIPDTSGTGAANWTTGYGSKYSLDISDPSHLDPSRQEFNTILYETQLELGAIQAMGVAEWADTTVNGGSQYAYSQYARVSYSGNIWSSLVGGNTATPGTDYTKWALAATALVVTGNFAGLVQITSTPVTLNNADEGKLHEASGSASAITMPAIANNAVGDTFPIVNYKSAAITITRDGTSTFSGVAGSTTTFSLPPYGMVWVVKATSTVWDVVGLQSNNTISYKNDGIAVQAYAGGGTALTFAHNLGVLPGIVTCYAVCTSADGQYSPGDTIVMVPSADNDNGVNRGFGISIDSTNVYWRASSAGADYVQKTSATTFTLTSGKWNIGVNVYA